MNSHEYDETQKMRSLSDELSNKKFRHDYPPEMQRTLHMIRQHDLVGIMIAKAAEQGAFDNLEGAGKPLKLDDTVFIHDDLHMVHKILKDSGFVPYWIELSRTINSLQCKLEKEVSDFTRYTQIVFHEKRSNQAISRFEQKKNHFYAQCRDRLEEISKKILDYNLDCPVSMGRINIDPTAEMIRITDTIETIAEHRNQPG